MSYDISTVSLALQAYPHLAVGKSLAVVRMDLSVKYPVNELRSRLLAGARSRRFVDGLIATMPVELEPAIRRLLDAWFVPSQDERAPMRRLRRVLAAANALHTCFAAAIEACADQPNTVANGREQA